MDTIIEDFDDKDLVVSDLEQEIKTLNTLIDNRNSQLESLDKGLLEKRQNSDGNNYNDKICQQKLVQKLTMQRESYKQQLLQIQNILQQLKKKSATSVKESFRNRREGWEAIICAKYRPVLPITEHNGKYTLRENDLVRLGVVGKNQQSWREIINDKQQVMLGSAHKVGRIGLFNSNYWQGTGTLLFKENLVITNRHVLTNNGFYELDLQNFQGKFFTGRFSAEKMPSTPAIDFNAVHNQTKKEEQRLSLDSPFVSHYLDYGLLTVKKSSGFLEVDMTQYSDDDLKNRKVYVLGHPAYDERAYASDLRIFHHYNSKHVMPGTIRSVKHVTVNKNVEPRIYHDCSTLGGCSGGPVVDMETGKVIAIHWGGVHREQNYALPIWALAQDLDKKQKKELYT